MSASRRHREKAAPTPDELAILRELEKKVLWLASWTIHHANHLRESSDGQKVGGHQASSASLAAIMTALYFHVLRPEDRVAVKPHASPVFHAIQYLLGNQDLDKLQNFRAFGGAADPERELGPERQSIRRSGALVSHHVPPGALLGA